MTLCEHRRQASFDDAFGAARGLSDELAAAKYALPAITDRSLLEVLFGMSPAGLTLIAGASGAGKTLAVALIAAQLAVERTPVAFVDCDQANARAFFKAAHPDAAPAVERVFTPVTFNGFRSAIAAIERAAGEVVILDSMTCAGHEGSPTPYPAAGPEAHRLAAAAVKHNVAVLATCGQDALQPHADVARAAHRVVSARFQARGRLPGGNDYSRFTLSIVRQPRSYSARPPISLRVHLDGTVAYASQTPA